MKLLRHQRSKVALHRSFMFRS